MVRRGKPKMPMSVLIGTGFRSERYLSMCSFLNCFDGNDIEEWLK